VSKRSVLHRLEPLTKRYFDEFHRCPACDQVYWKGSHHNRMLKAVEAVMENASRLGLNNPVIFRPSRYLTHSIRLPLSQSGNCWNNSDRGFGK
jgi:hypothetical protein